MKPFLIGCGLLAALGIVALIVLGFLVVPKFSEMKGNMEKVSQQMADLREDHPFEPPEDLHLIAERLDLVLEVRQDVADTVMGILEGARDKGFFKTFSSVLDIMSHSGETLADSLKRAQMSPGEYLWYGDRMAAATFRGRQPEADPALKAMWAAFRRVSVPRDSSVRVNQTQDSLQDLAIRAASVDLDPRDLELLISRRQAIIASMPGIFGDSFAEDQGFPLSASSASQDQEGDLPYPKSAGEDR